VVQRMAAHGGFKIVRDVTRCDIHAGEARGDSNRCIWWRFRKVPARGSWATSRRRNDGVDQGLRRIDLLRGGSK